MIEIVIRRRDRLSTAIVAVGEMLWDEDSKGYIFTHTVPERFQPCPLVVVEVDVYDGEDHVGHGDCLILMYPGCSQAWIWHGPRRDDDDATEVGDMPKPPGMILTFDPNDLIKAPELAR